MVLVRKKDKAKSLLICINMKNVNKAIVPECYPLPTIEELTAQLVGSTVFSKIDLKWGYLQIVLAEDKQLSYRV